MYNTQYECRYHKNDIFLETDNVSDDEKEFIRTVLYREDLINIFVMNEDDEFDFSIISELYNLVYKSTELMECMKIASAKILSEDEGSGLCILYSFDYMHFTHKCVASYLENGVISDYDLKNLKDILNL